MKSQRSWTRPMLMAVVVVALLVPFNAAAGATDPKPRAVAVSDLPNPDFEVFMEVGATRRQITDFRRGLVTSRGKVSRFAYLDKGAALAEFRRLFVDDPALVAKTDRDDLPVSFRVELTSLERDGVAFIDRAEAQPGVDEVVARSLGAGLAQVRRRAGLPECGGDPSVDATAFLEVDASPEDERRVEETLRAMPGVGEVRYVSHDEALRRFACIFQDEEVVAEARASGLPVSFDLVFAPGASESELLQAIRALVGPDNVRSG